MVLVFASQKREFFAEPLVSQLPDGFRLECEPNSASLRSQSELRSDDAPTEIDDILIIEQFFQHKLFVEQKFFCDLVT